MQPTELPPRLIGLRKTTAHHLVTERDLSLFREKLAAPRGIITLDIDGSLVDQATGLPTSDGLPGVIAKARKAGYAVCLNSDRSVGSVRSMQQMLGTDEPNFLEAGAVVDFPSLKSQVLFDEQAVKTADTIEEMVRENLAIRLGERGMTDVEVKLLMGDDPIGSIGNWNNVRNAISPKRNKLVVGFRSKLTSMGFWVLDNALSESPVANAELANQVAAQLQTYGELSGLKRPLHIAHNKSLTFHEPKTGFMTKDSMWRVLLNFLGEEERKGKNYFHIGDGVNDVIRDGRVKVLAVANAKDALKAIASRTSDLSVTSGVIDSIEYILSSY